MRLVVSLLCDVLVVTSGAGVTGIGFRDPTQLQVELMRLFDGKNALYEANRLSDQENMA